MGIESHVSKALASNGLADGITRTLEEIKNNLKKAQGCMKTQADKKCSKALTYVIRDLIWLSMNNLCLPYVSKKLSECWLGPYKFTKTVGPNPVELLLPKSICIHPVINIS